ncbi:MAG: 16S rRNA (cytidine(1402)-2'-O)-methyltransferase [Opitutales bacterium]|nr:16S rRNA (cytidine(1402)-2'-O)-methyltransferase [Opitutales bacterium]
MGLYIVTTPIGNLLDITYRAVECLRASDIIACEDTRITSKLLKHFGISSKPMLPYRDDNEIRVTDRLISELQDGKNVCLVSDAGTPCISDPGFRIVRAARKFGISVTVIPGACALVSALSGAGLPSDGFLFLGFLPAKSSARIKIFQKYFDFEYTLIFYESCHRLLKFLSDAVAVFGPTRCVCVAKEITKIHEHYFVGPLGTVYEEVSKSAVKGEFVVIIAPNRFEI